MCGPNRKGNQIRIQRVPGMLAKELRIRWKQAGIQNLQNPRKVDFRVFRIRMIAMNQKSSGGQGQQAYKDFNLQKESLHGTQNLMFSTDVPESGESFQGYLPSEGAVNAVSVRVLRDRHPQSDSAPCSAPFPNSIPSKGGTRNHLD